MIKPEDVKLLKLSMEKGRVDHKSREEADLDSKAWKTEDGRAWGSLESGKGELIGRIRYTDSLGVPRVFEHSLFFLPEHMKQLYVQFYSVLCQMDGTDPFAVLGAEWKKVFIDRTYQEEEEE